MRWWLAAAMVMAACDGDGSSDTAAEAPVVEADAFEHECVAGETHIFRDVRFVSGEWVDAQVWTEINPLNRACENQECAWVHQPMTLTEDGLVAVTCTTDINHGGEIFLRHRLLVRR